MAAEKSKRMVSAVGCGLNWSAGPTSYQQWDPEENFVFNLDDKVVLKRGVLLGLEIRAAYYGAVNNKIVS